MRGRGSDLRAFERARRRTAGSEVSASTWNRFIAALDKCVAWTLHENLLDRRPFRMIGKTALTPTGMATVRYNAEREIDEESTEVRLLYYEEYLLWRDVGLPGQLPSGAPDPTWRGWHGERNAVYADLLVRTGMRLPEASSLLVAELPPAEQQRLTGDLHLPAMITKRRRARTMYVSRRVLCALHQYVEIERDEVVARQHSAGTTTDRRPWADVRSTGRSSLAPAAGGRSRPYTQLTIAQRRDLRRAGDEAGPGGPLWLCLGENGMPLSRAT